MTRRLVRSGAQRGFTLVELLVSIAVLAVLASAAAPYMGDLVINARLREAGNLLFGEVLLAQSEAVKRNNTVRVTLVGSTVSVINVPETGATSVLRERTLPANVSGPTVSHDFGPEGRPAPFGTAISINLSASGTTCSSELRCPGLRVDAGGATRLCGNYQVNCS